MSSEIYTERKELGKYNEVKVGLRLQDAVLQAVTFEPAILEIHARIEKQRSVNSEVDERKLVLDAVSHHLFESDLSEALEEASRVLVPYRSNGDKIKTLIISSASSASASQETECAILKERGHIVDIPGAIEGRDATSAQDGDVILVSTYAGLDMARAREGVEIINLADEVILGNCYPQGLRGSDIYYKSDSLLMLIISNPDSPVLRRLTNEIAEKSLVYPYNLDEETQLVLLWMTKNAGVEEVYVNANSPEVGVELTRKGYRYPTLEDALLLPDYRDPYRMQFKEWELSQCARETGYHPDCVPGYVIKRVDTYEEFQVKVTQALQLLDSRYEFDTAWIKPDRGTDGGSQGSIGTRDGNKVEVTAKTKEMWEHGGDWVVEAKTNYFEIKLPINGTEKTLSTTPSVHVIKGEPRYTVSLQLVDGVAWGGNLICSQKTWEQLVEKIDPSDPRILNNPGLVAELKEAYLQMPLLMHQYVNAINTSERYKNGQVRGGADLAVATLGGKFGDDKLVISIQDYNARANGCETAYALYDHSQEVYKGEGEAITRNITPGVDFATFSRLLPQVIEKVNTAYGKNISTDQIKLIAVSAGWGQFGMIGIDSIEITQNIFLIEEQLRKSGLIK